MNPHAQAQMRDETRAEMRDETPDETHDEAQHDAAYVVVRGDVELHDDPIDRGWVLAGRPRARSRRWVTSPDRTTESFVWECTAGRFRWWFAADETVHVVEGSVSVTDEAGRTTTLHVGDAAWFRAGTWSTWEVSSYVRKHAVLRTPVPPALAPLAKGLGRRRHRLRG